MQTYKVFEAAERNDFDAVKMFIEKGGIRPTIFRYPHGGRWKQTLAHVAARNGNLKMLEYLVEKDSSILIQEDERTQHPEDLTIFEEAVKKGALDVVKYLVEKHNADIFEEKRAQGRTSTPVQMAVRWGHLNVTKYFVEERNVNVDRPCKTGASYCPYPALLFTAIEFEQDGIIKYLIEEKKANLTVVDDEGRNILFKAVFKENGLDLMKYVLDEKKVKIDIDWRSNDGQTVLWKAITALFIPAESRNNIIHYLVRDKHANITILDEKSQHTTLQEAILNFCDKELLECLVDCGANVAQRDKNGDTALHTLASLKGSRYNECKFLIEHGASVNQKNNKGETPLDIAISHDNHEVCKCLIEHGVVDINRKDEKGEALVHVAATSDNILLLEYLVGEKHADVNAVRTNDHWTPLHCAALWNNYKSCEYLIKHGADPVAKGTCGKTPAQVASDERLIDFLRIASSTTRTRRSVGHSQYSAFLFNSTPNEHSRFEITGISISLSDARLQTLHFHHFLIFSRWLMQFLMRGPFKDRFLHVGQQSAGSGAEILDSVAETAVGNLPRF